MQSYLRHSLKNQLQRKSYEILAGILLLIALVQAIQILWICDDAFFSLIYARNLSQGLGLVFQEGERVEGISNLLWTLILSIPYVLEMDPIPFALGLGILFYIALISSACVLEKREFPELSFPIFPLALGLYHHLAVFASSGLETMSFTCCIFLGIETWRRDSSISMLLFSLAAVLRPEGGLFLAYFALLDLFSGKRVLPSLGLGFLLCVALGRVSYYGAPVPNTFFAKAGFFWEDGILYLLSWFQDYPLFPFVFLLWLVLGIRTFPRESIPLGLYLLYVVSIGGDFMRQRFWIPILPSLGYYTYLALRYFLQGLQVESQRDSAWKEFLFRNGNLLVLTFLVAFGFVNKQTRDSLAGSKIWEESLVYKKELLSPAGYDKEAFQGLRLAFFGAQAHFIYSMPPAYALEAEAGLTDKNWARSPSLPGKRPGHRKQFTRQEAERRDLDLLLSSHLARGPEEILRFRFRGNLLEFTVLRPDRVIPRLCHRPAFDCSLLYRKE